MSDPLLDAQKLLKQIDACEAGAYIRSKAPELVRKLLAHLAQITKENARHIRYQSQVESEWTKVAKRADQAASTLAQITQQLESARAECESREDDYKQAVSRIDEITQERDETVISKEHLRAAHVGTLHHVKDLESALAQVTQERDAAQNQCADHQRGENEALNALSRLQDNGYMQHKPGCGVFTIIAGKCVLATHPSHECTCGLSILFSPNGAQRNETEVTLTRIQDGIGVAVLELGEVHERLSVLFRMGKHD